MLNNDQCIEVAEKVWGMDWNPITKSYYYHHIGYNNTKIHIEDLEREVNSWQGFGRTVEAMAGKKLSPDNIQEFAVIYEGFLAGTIAKEGLWEATRLAALEAVGEEEG